MIQFKNHTIFVKPSYGYCILIIKKKSFIDPETMESIILTNRHFIKKGFYRFMVEVNIGIKSSVEAVDFLNLNGNQKHLEKIAFVDYKLTGFNRFLINTFAKILYLNGSVKIKTFKTKRKAGLWLKE
jgi:hypothetical protein